MISIFGSFLSLLISEYFSQESFLFLFRFFLLISSDLCECLVKVSDDVVDVLGTDGQPDGGGRDSLFLQFSLVQLRVCRGCRVDDQ